MLLQVREELHLVRRSHHLKRNVADQGTESRSGRASRLASARRVRCTRVTGAGSASVKEPTGTRSARKRSTPSLRRFNTDDDMRLLSATDVVHVDVGPLQEVHQIEAAVVMPVNRWIGHRAERAEANDATPAEPLGQ